MAGGAARERPHRAPPLAAALAVRSPSRSSRSPSRSSSSPSSSSRPATTPWTTYKDLFEAAFTADGALSQTLIGATPLVFTGLCAAAAFRMNLFNIGGEGQLYFGAIGASAAGLLLRRPGHRDPHRRDDASPVSPPGAAWALIPGLLRAYLSTNEIITSLMLNYVAGLFLTYLIFDSHSYWRDTESASAAVFPVGKALPDAANWPTLGSSVVVPFGFLVGVAAAALLWLLYSRTKFGFEVQVMSDSQRAARYSGMRTRRKILAVMALSGGARRPRRREPGRRLPAHARRRPERPARIWLRLRGHRRRLARSLQPVRRRPGRVPPRRPPERRLRAAGA